MMTTNERTRGAQVRLLNPAGLLALGREYMNGSMRPELLRDGPLPQMYFGSTGKQIAVVNSEGVGYESIELTDGSLGLPIVFDYGGSWITVVLPLDEMARRGDVVTDELIDLSDGIERGSSRYDENFATWFDRHVEPIL